MCVCVCVCVIFIDLKKAYDRVPRVNNMYERTVTSVRSGGEMSSKFVVTVGLRQRSAMSLFLFYLSYG